MVCMWFVCGNFDVFPNHQTIFRGFVAELSVESPDSIPESADYTIDSVIVGRLPPSNMFDILSQPTPVSGL